jgi:FKBP-type peptidyl-prolyl cis-trans isomerase FkpA
MKSPSRRIAPFALSMLALCTCLSAGMPLAHATDPSGAPQSSASDAQAALPTFGRKKLPNEKPTAQENASEGAAFLAENAKKPDVRTTPSGLQYQVLKEGTGPKPKATDTVKVNYAGYLLDGTEFDSSARNGGPISFPVGDVVAGWTEGLQLMTVGSKYTFWIPSKLGYGSKGTPGGPIGPNATLKFDIELLSTGAQ